MRPHLLTFLAVLAVQPVEAQSGSPWTVTIGVEGLRFAVTARDTAVPSGQAAELRPNGRVGVRAGVQRGWGFWRVEFATGWAQGGVEAGNDVLAIRDRSTDFSRLRFASAVERVLIPVAAGTGELALGLGPAMDLWLLDGDLRTRLGGEGRLALRLALGAVALENRITLGYSASPLEAEDLGDGFAIEPLWALGFGVGVRFSL